MQPTEPALTYDIETLRNAIFQAKAKRRLAQGRAPILEKLKILEEMRSFTASLREVRQANKLKVKAAWTQP